MLNEFIKIEISANTVAWYGAILSTISLFMGIYKIWIDRPRLKIFVTPNLEILGIDTDLSFKNMEPGKTFWSIKIANIGRRSIIVESLEVDWRDKKSRVLIRRDYNGPIKRFELKPGESYGPIILDYDLIDINRVKNIYVRDATGKIYKHKIAHKA